LLRIDWNRPTLGIGLDLLMFILGIANWNWQADSKYTMPKAQNQF